MESKKFNKLCYDELRAVVNLTDKVFITSLFLFAMEDDLKYAKLLYKGYDHIIEEWERKEIFVELNFENKNNKQAIESITNKLIEKDQSRAFSLLHDVSKDLNFGDVTNLSKLPMDIDVLTGGFPCQSFSNEGKGKGMADPRGVLAFDMLRVVRENKPKIVIAENVTGLLQKKHMALLEAYTDQMEQMGYKTEVLKLRASEFGIPQQRDRVYIVSSINEFERDKIERATKQMDSITNFVDFDDLTSSVVRIEQATQKGYIELVTPGVADRGRWGSSTRRGRVKASGSICGTILTSCEHYAYTISGYRKLTPLECWRLMGFSELDYSIADGGALVLIKCMNLPATRLLSQY